MKRKNRILWGLGCIAVAAATMGFQSWRTAVIQRTGNRVLASAQSELKVGKGAAALDMLDQARPAPDQLEAWQRTEVEAATAALKLDRLNAIYDQSPERILENESATLLVYRSLIVQGKAEAAASVAAAWSGKSTRPATWTVHQADALIGQGQGAKARKLLEPVSGWAPPDELQRQLRLALLTATEDLNGAWAMLEKAYQLDPRHADVRSFRAQVLESAGRPAEARVEYVAALLAEPDSMLRRDQLAAFYLRQGDFDHAIPTWLEAPPGGQTAFMEVKGRFWAKVVSPQPAQKFPPTRRSTSSPDGKVLDAMELAPPGRWMAPVSSGMASSTIRQEELWWLSLLDLLQTGDEAEAVKTLATAPGKAMAMAPELAAALRTVLAVRAKRPVDGVFWPEAEEKSTRHSFYSKLAALTQAARSGMDLPDAEPLMAECRHPAALAYVLGAAGWREAALRLCPWESTAGLPESMCYTGAMCLKLNRGPQAVVAFLRDSTSPLLRGQRAESLIAAGQASEGLPVLAEVSRDDSAAGRRAGWLLALAHLEQRDFPAVTRVLKETPGLAEAMEGLEIAARLALAEQREPEASAIYRKAATMGSAEARTRILRESVKAGDVSGARQASMELRALLPDDMRGRSNQLLLPAAPAP